MSPPLTALLEPVFFFTCSHQIEACFRNLTATNLTIYLSDISLMSKNRSTVLSQSIKSSGCALPSNSGISNLIPILRSGSAAGRCRRTFRLPKGFPSPYPSSQMSGSVSVTSSLPSCCSSRSWTLCCNLSISAISRGSLPSSSLPRSAFLRCRRILSGFTIDSIGS
ncbi:hypothetical protein Hanom_Chr09g00854851 [Helianthus anomalus]